MQRSLEAAAVVLLATGAFAPARAAADYVIADTHADLVLSIDPDETLVLMNTFPVVAAGEYIDQIRIAYGRVGGPTQLNNRPVKILLYEDPNGGSTQDATLLWSMDTVIANGNTDTLNTYAVPGILVHGNLVAGFYYKNTTTTAVFIGALDTTAPTLSQRSYFGWTGELVTLDPGNLGAIPATQFMSQEASGNAGNYRIEAHGRAVTDVQLSVTRVSAPDAVRLTWNGFQSTYTVERAAHANFGDAVTIASGVPGPTFDDPVLADGSTWFYRVP